MKLNIVLALSAALLLAACGKDSAMKDDFIEGCTANGTASKKVCSCMYDKLEDKYGVSGLKKMSNASSPDEMFKTEKEADEFIAVMFEAAAECQ